MRWLLSWMREYRLVLLVVIPTIVFMSLWNNWEELTQAWKRSEWISPLAYGGVGLLYTWILVFHWTMKPRSSFGTLVIGMGALFALVMFLYGASHAGEMHAFSLIMICYIFGVLTFMTLSELLVNRGVGRYLTIRRGQKWVKEIEYFYLLLGALGIVSAMSKVPLVEVHATALDMAAPLILTFAISLRCVKTRAEIEGWNKKEFYESKS